MNSELWIMNYQRLLKGVRQVHQYWVAGSMILTIGKDENASAHGAGFSVGAGINLEQFKLNLAYGKYHAASNSILVNLAYSF